MKTEILVNQEETALLATGEMKVHQDQRGLKEGKELKAHQGKEAQWGRGESLVNKEMARKAVMASKVTLGPVETPVSRVPRELPDPKETMESPEIQVVITTTQGLLDPKGPKVTEDLRAIRVLLGRLDHQELMNVKFWISSRSFALAVNASVPLWTWHLSWTAQRVSVRQTLHLPKISSSQ